MNLGQARMRLVQMGALLAAAALVAGCGNNYRPVILPSNPSGPSPQPEAFAVVVSNPSSTAAGIATIIDYSGDTVMAQATNIGVDPLSFTVDASGTSGYTINSNSTLTYFPVSTSLQNNLITYTTLASNAQIVNLFSPSSGLWAADLTGNVADVFAPSSGVQTFLISDPVAATPVMVVGAASGSLRDFAISQNISSPTGMECNQSPTAEPLGTVTGIETANYAVDSPAITVGRCPVYGVESSDGLRLFVLNRGSDTVSVIDTQNDRLDDQCPTGCVNKSGQTYHSHPTLPLSLSAVSATGITPVNGTTGMAQTAGPVYAEYNAATSQLVVANYDGGTVSIIDVSLDAYGNDSSTFGTTYTVGVGNNPASVTALYDGSRAYAANQSDGTVSVVYMSTSHTVEKTLAVVGHPRTVVSIQNSEYGKVYVASPDNPDLTIISTGGTDPDIVDTTLSLLAGNILDVRVNSQNAEGGNSNTESRLPGFGEPCNLPLSEFNPATSSNPTLANCQAQASSLLVQPLVEPPTISCSAYPTTIMPGETSTIIAVGVSPQNRPLTYSYSASAGSISGSSTTATFNSTGAPTGPVSIACNVSDDRGHSASAETSVTIVAPQP
jgi:YVTN family beta-propeller protein